MNVLSFFLFWLLEGSDYGTGSTLRNRFSRRVDSVTRCAHGIKYFCTRIRVPLHPNIFGVFVVFWCILDVFWCILMYLYFPPKYIFACKIRKKTALKNLPRIREIHEEYILNTLEYTQIHSNTPKYSMCSRGSYRVFAVFRCILMYSHMYSAA